ncbi:hypothetical protein LEP1GSC192_1443 [Leptospira sp. B5-022]|nr:hypothetical protein LEP1GSC192_1443 [Leptospira sp. B5-022]
MLFLLKAIIGEVSTSCEKPPRFSKKMLMEISDSFELLDEPKKGKFFLKFLQIYFLHFFKNR